MTTDPKTAEIATKLRYYTAPGPWAFDQLLRDAADLIDALRAENERLRQALIDAGNNAGAWLSQDVTTEFLCKVPKEVLLKIERLVKERDAYKTACKNAGVCMTCVLRAPEPYGCTDCFNTGWQQGDPYARAEAAEAALAKANERIAECEANAAHLVQAGDELADAAADIHPAAPTRAAIDRLYKAIDTWEVGVPHDTPPAPKPEGGDNGNG